MSPESMRVRSTISVAVTEIILNLVLVRFNNPQLWRFSIQAARHVATPEPRLKVVSKYGEKQTHCKCK